MPASKGQIACAGVAGVFTKQQLGLLHHCIPGGIVSQEPDRKVGPALMPKAEYTDYIAASNIGMVQHARQIQSNAERDAHLTKAAELCIATLPPLQQTSARDSAAHSCLAHSAARVVRLRCAQAGDPAEDALQHSPAVQRYRGCTGSCQSYRRAQSHRLSPFTVATTSDPGPWTESSLLIGGICVHLRFHPLGLFPRVCRAYILEKA